MTSPFSFYFSSFSFALYLLPQQPPIHTKTETANPSYCTQCAARFKDILQLYLLIISPKSFHTPQSSYCCVQRWPVQEVSLLSLWHPVQNIKKWGAAFYSLGYFCFISALWWAWYTIQPDRHFLWTVSSNGRKHYRDQPSCGVLFWRTER